jgi:Lon protease-like protein
VTDRIPLFPLATPLFPGLVLPLNVFEDRYRALVADLLTLPEGAARRFGVVAIRNGQEVAPTGQDGLPAGPTAGLGEEPLAALYGVGCIADATGIAERESGGYELVATGLIRFRLLSLDASGAYLTAEVEQVPEDAGAGAGALASEVTRVFGQYQKRLAGARERTLAPGQEFPDAPAVLSYLVAAALIAEAPVKQALLEEPDAAARLAAELRLLRRETALIEKLPSLPAVDLTAQPISAN